MTLFAQVIGLTGWTMHQIVAHTFPQLDRIVRANGGVIRYVRDEVHLRYHFGKVASSEEAVTKLAAEYDRLTSDAPPPAYVNLQMQKAYRAFTWGYGLWTKDQPMVEPLPISREAARGLIAWWQGPTMPWHIWDHQLAALYQRIIATADA